MYNEIRLVAHYQHAVTMIVTVVLPWGQYIDNLHLTVYKNLISAKR